MIDPKTLPMTGDVWKHYKGGLYQIIAIARFELGLEIAVVYQSLTDGSTWVRDLSEWNDQVEEKTRFTRIKP
jgi:hypothetical protein